jgi:hypothetical protein
MKWEYLIIALSITQETFNEYGKEGWEFICLTPNSLCIFKRTYR